MTIDSEDSASTRISQESLSSLPGLNSPSRMKQWLAVGYYGMMLIILVGGLTQGFRGFLESVIMTVALAVPVWTYIKRSRQPLIGGAGPKKPSVGSWSF